MNQKKIYIGGQRSDYKKLKLNFTTYDQKNVVKGMFMSFHGRGYYGMREILIKELRLHTKIILHCPQYNCWESFDLAIKDLSKIILIKYDNYEQLHKSLVKYKEHNNCILIIDYFGVSDIDRLLMLSQKFKATAIVDLANTFPTLKYIRKLIDSYTYVLISLRKFLPVPAGAIVFSHKPDIPFGKRNNQFLPFWLILKNSSNNKTIDYMLNLFSIRRTFFKWHNKNLNNNFYTQGDIDYFFSIKLENLLDIRKKNYSEFLKSPVIKKNNLISFCKIRSINIHPLYLPLKCKDPEIVQNMLSKENIYCPIFWPDSEKKYRILGLPIDDRYSTNEVKKISILLESLDYAPHI